MATAVPTGGGSSCLTNSTDPSNLLNCTSGNTTVLSNSGSPGGPIGEAVSPKPTPITDSFRDVANEQRQDVGGMKLGGFVGSHYASGGAVGYASGGAVGYASGGAVGYASGGAATGWNAVGCAREQDPSGTATCTAPTAVASGNTTSFLQSTAATTPQGIGCYISCGGLGSTNASYSLNPTAISNAGVPVNTPWANQNALCAEKEEANQNYALNSSETVNPTMLKDSACQELCPNAVNINTPQANATTVNNTATANQVAAPPAATYSAATINPNTVPQISAAQMAVPGCTNSTATAGSIYQGVNNPAFSVSGPTATSAAACPLVSNQIAQLTKCLCNNNAPAWAQGAINATNSQMAARGLGTSSIAAGANTASIEAAALPVAQANSNVIMQAQLANLSNQQQALLANQSAFMTSLTSNQAAENAAMQFNATSQNQVSQFFANLNSQIQLSNAAQVNAMAQFNAGQLNSVSEFNATMANNVNQFNATNQLAIDQSNVTWRRNINTINTAAINAAQQTNAQNELNLTTTAQNNLWQQFQDEASWANTDAQNALTRAQNMAIAALGASTATNLQNSAEQAQMLQYLGSFGINLLTGSGGLLGGSSGISGSAATNLGNSLCSSANTLCGSLGCLGGCGSAFGV